MTLLRHHHHITLQQSSRDSLTRISLSPRLLVCRGTGFGFCNAMCKLAAVMGNLIFGSLVGITKAIPILLASSVLVAGGLVGLRLPDTRANVLM